MTWLIATIVKRNRRALVIYHTLMVAVAGFVLYLQMDEYWYDTIMCYALGFAYSQYKEELESIIKKNYVFSSVLTLALFFAGYVIVKRTSLPLLISFNFWALCFAMIFMIFGMKLKVGNRFINWCGKHLFPIYMYQGLFFHILFNIGGEKHSFAAWSPFLYTLLSVILSIVLAHFYRLWEVKLK